MACHYWQPCSIPPALLLLLFIFAVTKSVFHPAFPAVSETETGEITGPLTEEGELGICIFRKMHCANELIHSYDQLCEDLKRLSLYCFGFTAETVLVHSRPSPNSISSYFQWKCSLKNEVIKHSVALVHQRGPALVPPMFSSFLNLWKVTKFI